MFCTASITARLRQGRGLGVQGLAAVGVDRREQGIRTQRSPTFDRLGLTQAMVDVRGYPALLGDIKARIQGARVRAALAAGRELLLLYWDVGQLIAARQEQEGWGAGVIPRYPVH